MLGFFEAHKDWIAAHIGVAAVLLAPKLGVPPEQLTAAISAIGGIVVAYVASHNYQKAKASQP